MAFNQKNPPWQRNAGHQNMSNMQAIVGFPQAQPVYNPNIGLQQQQNISILPQMGMQQQQAIYSQTVQYPTNRPVNAIGFQNQPQSQPAQLPVSQNSSKFNPSQRNFSGTGMVTKVQVDFGFIDDEVFFHKNSCVKGVFPKVGDRVLVDAAYNSNMPFKWNASRVQVLNGSNTNSSSSVGHSHSSHARSHTSIYSKSHSSHTSESRSSNVRNRYSSPSRKSLDRHRSSDRPKDDYDDSDRRRKRDDRDSDRSTYREKHRDRSSDRGRERERSPIRKPSPKRRRVRSVPRYMVQVPKHLLTIKQADVLELRRRYNNLYIPSDFFVSDIRWSEAFPPDAPFSIRSPCFFHVMHKDVEPPPALTAGASETGDASADPPDADYLFSAKVMLMSTPPLTEFYANCISKSAGENGDRYESERNHMHPTRMISFLVGMRGKNETMAIGGPWSPSLDGTDPQSDPTVLIRTAVRTCRALTGIDLSNCSQWYRFVELYYRRSESYHKGRLIPPRVETVVIFLPDVRSCQPTRLEWEQLRLSYKASLTRIINCSSSSSGGGGGGGGSSSNGEEAAADTAPPAEAPAADDVTNSSSTTTINNTINNTSAVAPPSSIAAASEQAESSTASSSPSAADLAAEPAQQEPLVAGETAVATISSSASYLAADSADAAEEKDANVGSAPAAAEAASATPSAKSPAAKPSSAAAKPTPPAAAATKMDTAEGPYFVPDLVQEYKKMKVADLKAELSKRNLPTDGLKATLVERLSEAVVQQHKEEHQMLIQQALDDTHSENDVVVKEEEQNLEPVKMDEEEELAPVDTNIKQEQFCEGEEEPGSAEKVVVKKEQLMEQGKEEAQEGQDPVGEAVTIKQETTLDVNTDVEMTEIALKPEDHENKQEKDVAEASKVDEVPSKLVKDESKEGKEVAQPLKGVETPSKPANDEPKQEKVVVEAAKAAETLSKPVNHESKQEKSGAETISEKTGSTTESSKPAVVARKKEEPVKLTEKERQLLERRYQLPEKPHMIVHPSRMAKSGKFDCSIMSLSVLLDYRLEDTKEHSFEVALFSELFNEMLTRDFGFNIYRALCEMPSRKQESDDSKKDGPADGKATAETSAATSNGEESSGKTSEKGDETKKKSAHADDKEPRDRKRSRRSETPDGDRVSRDKDSSIVINSELLLSFVYFDVTHCGYIAEKDVEDLIYTLGLNLSRSQIRKTVAKATTREPWYYRKLTDKVVSLPAATTSQADETVSPAEKAADADKTVEMQTDNDASEGAEKKQSDEQSDADAPEAVICGNTDYKQQLKASLEQLLKEYDGEGRLRQQQHASPRNSTSTNETSQLSTTRTGIIEYNGCVVDVGKLLEQVKRTESAREEGEKQLVSLQGQYAELLSNHTRATSKIKDLQSETKSLSKQLADSVRVSRNASQTQAEYLSVIHQVYDRVRPIAQRSTRDGSSSAGSKRESSKEKSSRVTTSSKSKEKEKEKESQPKDSAARKEDDKGTKEKGGDSATKNKTEDGVGGGDGGGSTGSGGDGGTDVEAATGTTD
ncbi:cell division cycle and apoptosis regulator protein 1-like [Anopheles ziemanni]|uniref:cell division cycle and apoptosis regulator protein 1-like n=1 Tax=Anopheles coustani TaxID=139045 RepID=UPI00265A68E5|nr:cell division cycle and apoptosis regulator protein 1-like [Anopheles coustani]XP_058176323.1 cell division cycle and apoptosis regulator protein 1-like [Anopheles ziemanni]